MFEGYKVKGFIGGVRPPTALTDKEAFILLRLHNIFDK